MLNLQPVLHGQTSKLKTPKDCSPESRRHFNLRQSPDQWELRLETPPIAPRLGQEKTLPRGWSAALIPVPKDLAVSLLLRVLIALATPLCRQTKIRRRQ